MFIDRGRSRARTPLGAPCRRQVLNLKQTEHGCMCSRWFDAEHRTPKECLVFVVRDL